MRSRFIAFGAALAFGFVLASCGGGGDTTTTSAPAAGTTTSVAQSGADSTTATTGSAPTTETTAEDSGSADGQSLAIRASDELRFEPDTIEMTPGQQVELTFRNVGSVPHSLAILKADSELEHVLGETDEVHRDEELVFEIHPPDAGAEATETFVAPSEPGEYIIACLVTGHADAGMVGTLTVR